MSERLHRAIDLAARAHAKQTRKDQDMKIPYVAHVFGVAMLLSHHGFSEDVVVAGLLHDVLEDSPAFGAEVAKFGDAVLGWVRTVTDPDKVAPGAEEMNWVDRKGAYIEQVRAGDPEAKAVACADKIHNMESTWMRMRRGDRLTGARPLDEQVYYWRQVRKAFGAWQHPMLDAYDDLLSRLSSA